MISCLHTHFFVQVRRLFRLIYHSRHFYLIHVDSRQDYLQRQVAALAEEVSHSVVMLLCETNICFGVTTSFDIIIFFYPPFCAIDSFRPTCAWCLIGRLRFGAALPSFRCIWVRCAISCPCPTGTGTSFSTSPSRICPSNPTMP